MSQLDDLPPVAAQPVELPVLEQLAPKGTSLLAQRFDLIGGLKVSIEAKLGNVEMSVEELFGLRENSTLSLQVAPTDPIDLTLDGKLVGRGTLVVVGDSFGIRITEIAAKK
ncbi:MAG: FliM/FliN family flagellar motor switch protein [Rhodocyclaceae bacterium]